MFNVRIDPAITKRAVFVVKEILLVGRVVEGDRVGTGVSQQARVPRCVVAGGRARPGFVRQDRLGVDQDALRELVQKAIVVLLLRHLSLVLVFGRIGGVVVCVVVSR